MILRRRRLDVDDRVGNLRVACHQPVLDHMRERVRVAQPHLGRQPHVQIQEHVIGRSTGPDVMAAQHARHAQHDLLEVGVGDHDSIAQDPGGRARHLISGIADEPRHDERGQRIENREPRPRAGQRDDDGDRGPHVALRLHRVGHQHLAGQPLRFTPLVDDDPEIDADRCQHDDEAGERNFEGRSPSAEMVERVPQDLDDDEKQEDDDGGCRDRLVLAVSVRMIRVWRPSGRLDADEADDIRRRVGQRVESVGQNADGAAGVPERDLRNRDADVEEEHPDEHSGDSLVARRAEG
jgi:hypothetical protein